MGLLSTVISFMLVSVVYAQLSAEGLIDGIDCLTDMTANTILRADTINETNYQIAVSVSVPPRHSQTSVLQSER